MFNLSPNLVKELDSYQVSIINDSNKTPFISFSNNIDNLLSHTKHKLGTDNSRVAASMLIRRYSSLLTALLLMISKHRLAWNGKLENILMRDDIISNHETWSPTFAINSDTWSNIEESNVELSFHTLLSELGNSLFTPLESDAKISKLVLWENLWGYTLWMYSKLLSEPDLSYRVERDIAILLDNNVWCGIEKESPFKKFLGEYSVLEAVTSYKRITCCYYYELRGQSTCPYCPKNSRKAST
ncbi:MAG: hypothetical protein K0S34_2085 [Bacillales bacterium]|jgi:ferric iron reductase protein FhuF|nr:hypothetical protein [Bacillales bacterium]